MKINIGITVDTNHSPPVLTAACEAKKCPWFLYLIHWDDISELIQAHVQFHEFMDTDKEPS